MNRWDPEGRRLYKWNDLSSGQKARLEAEWSRHDAFVGYGRTTTGYLKPAPTESVHGRAATRRRAQAAARAPKA